MSNRAKLFIPGIFFLAMLGLLLFGLNTERDPNKVPSAMINRAMPAFSKPDLFKPGTEVDSGILDGKLTLLNVWGTWCPPCHAEHPFLMQISEAEGEALQMVGVNYKDDPEEARLFLDERGNPFDHNVVDVDGSLGIDLGVAGAPETFIIDETGTIRFRHVGEINQRVWDDILLPVLEQLR